ncbi:hypothetical protein BH20ACT24_BH20ACT24_12070 [soil metagenome]
MSEVHSRGAAPPPPSTWGFLEAVLLYVISLVVAGVVIFGLFSAVASCRARFLLGALTGQVVLASVVLVWVRYVKRTPLASLGVPRRPLLDVALGMATGLGLYVVGVIVGALVLVIATVVLGHRPDPPEQVVSCVRGAALLLSAPIIVLGAPLAEETFFRGFLYRGLRRRLSIWPAAVLSALVFGVIHYAEPSYLLIIPSLAAVGLGLALLYERRQSLLAAIAAHASFNLVGFLLIAFTR